MTKNTIGKFPEFDGETPLDNSGNEEVKEASTEEVEEETDTPSESSTEEKEVSEDELSDTDDETEDTQQVVKQVEGLTTERDKLLEEIKTLRGERRNIKEEKVKVIEEQIDDLKDLNPDDIATIERIVKAKGYTRKEDIDKKFYKEVEQEELNKFLDKYPEFKPENDPNDKNWNALQTELAWYKMPSNPRQVAIMLERARKHISTISSERINPIIQKQKLNTAGKGGGGQQRSSSSISLTADKIQQLKRGGFTDEDIQEMSE